MKERITGLALAIVLTAVTAAAQKAASSVPASTPGSSVEQLPPGDAMKLAPLQARKQLEDALAKKYSGPWSQCALLICGSADLEPASGLQVRLNGFEFSAPYKWKGLLKDQGAVQEKIVVKFSKVSDYLSIKKMPMMRTPKPVYVVGFLQAGKKDVPFHMMELLWTEQAVAQGFADAFNRLVYLAHQGGPNSREGFLLFATEAKAWRENPQKPPLPADADRERILAENAIREKDLNRAIAHYENGLLIHPMWPEAWFNTALIYGELQDYESAANSMRRYLELMPNAPDAQAAREKLVIWEDKAGGNR